MTASPLTGSPCRKTGSIPTQVIVASYREALDMDVSRFFPGLPTVDIYECPDTGYRFFHPFSVAGDGKFYEELQQFDWYYMPWKWEHEKALASIRKTDKILEVGSGGNGFMEKLHGAGYKITGLELNERSVEEGRKKGLMVLGETVQEHAEKNTGRYDIVCSFQVLEHISDVKSFLEGMIECLKPGGSLIICVPNNDSFIKYSFDRLNVPPHHMGLWNEQSLRSLSRLFPLQLEEVAFQPLQHYHRYYFFSNIYKGALGLPHIAFKVLRRLSPASLEKILPKRLTGAYVEVRFRRN